MINAIVLLTVIGFACGDYTDKFVGDFVVAAGIPVLQRPANVPKDTKCRSHSFAKKNSLDCSCEGFPNVKTLEFGVAKHVNEVPVIEVRGNDDTVDVLNTPRCDCGGKDYKPFVLKFINNDFFAYYEPHTSLVTRGVLTAVIFSKGAQSSEALDAAIKSVPELKDKTYETLCIA